MENILAEAKTLADAGYRELILVAQDLTHYGTDLYGKRNLAGLLTELCKVEGIEWIRLHYLYPHELSDDLIASWQTSRRSSNTSTSPSSISTAAS
jgi:ribosomal protein S12 methylthiotransferase